jgi:hypothetical protein
VVVKPGYYLVQGNLPTRVALWFLLTGQLGDLRIPCNWNLTFEERTPDYQRRLLDRSENPRRSDVVVVERSGRASSTFGGTTQGDNNSR